MSPHFTTCITVDKCFFTTTPNWTKSFIAMYIMICMHDALIMETDPGNDSSTMTQHLFCLKFDAHCLVIDWVIQIWVFYSGRKLHGANSGYCGESFKSVFTLVEWVLSTSPSVVNTRDGHAQVAGRQVSRKALQVSLRSFAVVTPWFGVLWPESCWQTYEVLRRSRARKLFSGRFQFTPIIGSVWHVSSHLSHTHTHYPLSVYTLACALTAKMLRVFQLISRWSRFDVNLAIWSLKQSISVNQITIAMPLWNGIAYAIANKWHNPYFNVWK